MTNQMPCKVLPPFAMTRSLASGQFHSNGDEQRSIPTEAGDYPAYYRGVVDALRTDAAPPVDVRESIEGLEVLEAARESSRAGAVVRLPEIDEERMPR